MPNMKTSVALLILSLMLSQRAFGQVEHVPQQEAQKAALMVNNALGEPDDLPFTMELNFLKPDAIKGGEAVLLVVPVYRLKEKLIAAGEGEILPAGQLWLHKVVPEVNQSPAKKTQLRPVKATGPEGEQTVSLSILAVRKNANGAELLVYGKGDAVLVTRPMRKMTVPQAVPIELDGRKRNDQSGELTLYFGDQFEATLIVRAPGEE